MVTTRDGSGSSTNRNRQAGREHEDPAWWSNQGREAGNVQGNPASQPPPPPAEGPSSK